MADKNIIDGIEYETEPHPDYLIDGKPVYYAKNVPELLRGDTEIKGQHKDYARALNRQTPLAVFNKGDEAWNLWIRWSHNIQNRWCEQLEDDEKVYVRLKKDSDENYETAHVSLAKGTTAQVRNVSLSDFTKYVFPGPVSFEGVRFQLDANFSEIKFQGPVSFKQATFNAAAIFNGAVFRSHADFSYSTIVDQLGLINTSFEQSVDFQSANLRSSGDFANVDFQSDVSFASAKIEALLKFSDIEFSREANFSGAEFTGDLVFQDVKFLGDLYLMPKGVNGTTRLIGVDCRQASEFRSCQFNGPLWLESSKFHGYSDFNGAHMRDALVVKSCEFKKTAIFHKTQFFDAVAFQQSVFGGEASFVKTTFQQMTKFKDVVFFERVRWDSATFNGSVEYCNCQFVACRPVDEALEELIGPIGEVEFPNTTFNGYVSFDHVWFGVLKGTPWPLQYDEWSVSARNRYEKIRHKLADFAVPNFKGTHFKITPNLGYTEVPPPRVAKPRNAIHRIQRLLGFLDEKDRILDADAAAKLRKLGELAGKGHHHIAEKRFFRAELLCRRGHEANGWREVAMINAFELFSKCGLSFWRPLGWLLGLVLLSSLFYGLQISWPAGESGPFELASYSFANSLPLLGYISDSYEVSVNVLFGGVDKVPPWVRVWAFFQNLVSAVLIFFALLAIRNYFKLG